MDDKKLDLLVVEFKQKIMEKKIRGSFIFWGQNSPSRDGGFVYDGNQMTWSSVYGPNGCGLYSQSNEEQQEENEWWNDKPAYGPDYNFNDGDW